MTSSIARILSVLTLFLMLRMLSTAQEESASALGAGVEAWTLSEPAPVDPDFPERLEDYQDLSCAMCHEVIAEEWSRTLHALAWEDPRYQKEIKGRRRKESCVGCHAPEPMFRAETFGAKPAPRDEEPQARHFGVSCRSCHLAPERGVVGPNGYKTDAHPSTKDARMSGVGSNELCIACHKTNIGPVIGIAKDFLAERLGEEGLSCVGCHMAPVERPMATDDDDEPTQVRVGRSHLLQTPRDPGFLAQTFALEARVEGAETVLTIANRAGHRVPGLRERQIVFTASALDPGGEVLAEGELVIDSRAYLAVKASLELRLASPAARVRVLGVHVPPGASGPRDGVTFLESDLVAK